MLREDGREGQKAQSRWSKIAWSMKYLPASLGCWFSTLRDVKRRLKGRGPELPPEPRTIPAKKGQHPRRTAWFGLKSSNLTPRYSFPLQECEWNSISAPWAMGKLDPTPADHKMPSTDHSCIFFKPCRILFVSVHVFDFLHQVYQRLMALLFVGFVLHCSSGSFPCRRMSALCAWPSLRRLDAILSMSDHYTTCSPPQYCPLAARPLEMLRWPLQSNHHEIVCKTHADSLSLSLCLSLS
ncbi:uncharacterized protein LOC133548782 [Nerophis ophidion]|uniref:uncharacterized protein LOC133548782 n=1 Tax=Nerophis ophidion TaxID=159077 RepID=UPI002ADFD399|nr:uncharacterized protein LOC133548782 [Nerophis ophidion]